MRPEEIQQALCARVGAPCQPVGPELKVGIAENVRSGHWPVNGLRHPQQDGASGWFIWAGETLSDADDFFLPLHAAHLGTWRPEVLPYLGLPPGYRFLIAPGYEDVWEDVALLSAP